MKKATLIISLLFLTLNSCKGQDIRKVKLNIINESKTEIDSIIIRFFETKKTIYKLKAGAMVINNFEIDYNTMPNGERVVFGISSFKDDYFFGLTNGFVGFPYTKLEGEYSFWIYDNRITIEKDFVPINLPKKHNISQYNKPFYE